MFLFSSNQEIQQHDKYGLVWNVYSSVDSPDTIFNDYKTGNYISSPIFTYNKYTLFIKFYPNKRGRTGTTIYFHSKPKPKQTCDVDVIFMDDSRNEKWITIYLLDDNEENAISEKKIRKTWMKSYDADTKFDADIIKNLSSLKIAVKLPTYRSYRSRNLEASKINYTVIDATPRTKTYKWKIKDTSKRTKYSKDKYNNQLYVSPLFQIHSFKWILYITENKDLYITCVDFPSNTGNISSIKMIVQIEIQQQDGKYYRKTAMIPNYSLSTVSDCHQFQCLSQKLKQNIFWLFQMFGIKWKISTNYNRLEL
eukprot:544833_1